MVIYGTYRYINIYGKSFGRRVNNSPSSQRRRRDVVARIYLHLIKYTRKLQVEEKMLKTVCVRTSFEISYDNPFGIVKTFVAICSQSDTIVKVLVLGEHPHETGLR